MSEPHHFFHPYLSESAGMRYVAKASDEVMRRMINSIARDIRRNEP